MYSSLWVILRGSLKATLLESLLHPAGKHSFSSPTSQFLKAPFAFMMWTWLTEQFITHLTREASIPPSLCLKLSPLLVGPCVYTLVEPCRAHFHLPGTHCFSSAALHSFSRWFWNRLKHGAPEVFEGGGNDLDSFTNHPFVFLYQCVQFPLLPFCPEDGHSGLR